MKFVPFCCESLGGKPTQTKTRIGNEIKTSVTFTAWPARCKEYETDRHKHIRRIYGDHLQKACSLISSILLTNRSRTTKWLGQYCLNTSQQGMVRTHFVFGHDNPTKKRAITQEFNHMASSNIDCSLKQDRNEFPPSHLHKIWYNNTSIDEQKLKPSGTSRLQPNFTVKTYLLYKPVYLP